MWTTVYLFLCFSLPSRTYASMPQYTSIKVFPLGELIFFFVYQNIIQRAIEERKVGRSAVHAINFIIIGFLFKVNIAATRTVISRLTFFDRINVITMFPSLISVVELKRRKKTWRVVIYRVWPRTRNILVMSFRVHRTPQFRARRRSYPLSSACAKIKLILHSHGNENWRAKKRRCE